MIRGRGTGRDTITFIGEQTRPFGEKASQFNRRCKQEAHKLTYFFSRNILDFWHSCILSARAV